MMVFHCKSSQPHGFFYNVLQTNQMLERHKPWLLVKDVKQHHLLQSVLFLALECLRLSAILLWPVMPQSSTSILSQLGSQGGPKTADFKCHIADSTGQTPHKWPYTNLLAHCSRKQVLFSKMQALPHDL